MDIPDVFQRFQSQADFRAHSWLLLGKGPSFGKINDYDVTGYKKLSLNHVVREMLVAVAHMIDWDVFVECAEAVDRNAEMLVMPWFPHVQNRAGKSNLLELCAQHPTLERLRNANRLAWYNLNRAPSFRSNSPVVSAMYFSAEAALNVLAMAGVRTVRSLGIDGGAAYSSRFSDLEGSTLLSNSQASFDAQFGGIAATILRTGVDYAPLDIESPVRVFVATTEAQMLSFKVLEFSIRKHASMSVSVVPIHTADVTIPTPRDERNRQRTPFSFQRFLIPQLSGFRGRAIYLDSDMQVFRDIRELWTYPMEDASVLTVRSAETRRRPQFSVMLLDCAKLDWKIDQIVRNLDDGRLSYEELMFELKVARNVRFGIEPDWNSLEHYRHRETALLHYTDMHTQPWVSANNPLGHLWVNCLIEAIDHGALTLDFVRDHVNQGYVRPSLLYQVEQRIVDSLPYSKFAATMDTGFSAPFEEIVQRRGRPWSYPIRYIKALLRNFAQRLQHPRLRRILGRLFMR